MSFLSSFFEADVMYGSPFNPPMSKSIMRGPAPFISGSFIERQYAYDNRFNLPNFRDVYVEPFRESYCDPFRDGYREPFKDGVVDNPYPSRGFQYRRDNPHFAMRPAVLMMQTYANQNDVEEIHCLTCNIWLHGSHQFKLHTQGVRHQKNIKEEQNQRKIAKMPFIKFIPESGVYQCTYCRTVLNSCSVAVMHVGGVKHLEKVREAHRFQKADKDLQEKAEGEMAKAEAPQSSNGDHLKTFRCDDCNIVANSEAQLAQHLASQRHLAKDQWKPNQRRGGQFKRHWVPASSGEGSVYKPVQSSMTNQPLSCEVCNVTVNSASQLSQHMASLRHKNMVSGARFEPYNKTS